MNSLAFTPKKSTDAPVEASSPEPRTQYPRLRFNGPQAESAGLHRCSLGDEYEITLRIKASQLGGSDYDNTEGKPPAEFDVLSASEPKEVESEEEDDGEDDDSQSTTKAQKSARRVKSPKDMGFKDAYEDAD